MKGFFKKNKEVFLVFLLFFLAFYFLQFRVSNIIEYDGYLHIKTAELMKNGLIRRFYWTENSILNADNYADIQFLFRLLLIPFTFLGMDYGAKLAAVIFSSLLFVFFYFYLKKSGIRYPFIFSSLYFLSSVEIMYRLLLTRPMALSALFLVLTLYFIDRKRYLALAFVSFAYVWLYSGFVFMFFVIFAYLAIDLLIKKKIDYKLALFPFLGLIAGLVINPYFPNNIAMYFTQMFKVNLISNLYNAEWKPWGFYGFIANNFIILGCFFTGIFFNLKESKFSRRNLALFFIALVFLIFTIKSRRMQEYFAPFAILFFAFSANNFLAKLNERKAVLLRYSMALVLIALFAINFIYLGKMIDEGNFLYKYEKGALWIKNNVPEDSLIFINAYAFNYLFFYDSDARYTHGIDLTYSYLYDQEKFERYMHVLKGDKEFDYNVIKADYSPDYVFVGKIKVEKGLIDFILKFKDDFELAYEDEDTAVFRVRK